MFRVIKKAYFLQKFIIYKQKYLPQFKKISGILVGSPFDGPGFNNANGCLYQIMLNAHAYK